jgi:hypothetical protein
MALAYTYFREQVDVELSFKLSLFLSPSLALFLCLLENLHKIHEDFMNFKGLQKNLQAIWNWFVIWDFLSGRCMRRL